MTRIQSPSAEFVRRGFDAPSATARIWEAWVAAAGGAPLGLAAFDGVADRDQALDSAQRIAAADPERFALLRDHPAWLNRVLLVLGGSSVLAQTLVRHPALLDGLADEPRPRGRNGWLAFFSDRVGIVDGVATGGGDALRLANREALIEIAARDLAAPDPLAIVDGVAAELAHVADAVLEAALAVARADEPRWRDVRLAVLAMGKTGAGELNYISDVDVIYVAEPAAGTDPTEALAVATRLAAAQARICSAHTSEGTIWQVDAALRPEGKAGPLVRTLASHRAYYGKWAKNWEFQAMLKARPAAGDLDLGQEFVELVSPLVWRAGERPDFVADARAMRERVISLLPSKQAAREIKLGEGGLRDTEFSVQLLQLVHGRTDERLRVRGTFTALDELTAAGYIGRGDGARMTQAYRFQRVLEHRIQLRRLRRTHLLPDEDVALRQLARSLGMTVDELLDRWKQSAREVRSLQQRIFFSPLLEAVSQVPSDRVRLTPDAAIAWMGALGFQDPRAALGHLEALTRGSGRGTEIQRQLLPAMLGWFAEGPNPDFGLLAFRQLSESLGDASWYLRALRDDGYTAHRLAKVVSTSRYVVDLLRRSPDMIRMMSSNEELTPRTTAELTRAMARAAARHDNVEKAIASVRAIRRAELCRIALTDVLGHAEPAAVGTALSDLASATVEAGLLLARRDVEAPSVGVIALGRWGGGELSYSSDVDCMFVIADGEDPAAATELVRRAIHIVGAPGPDPALVVDTDLRPEGRGGPQVRTVSSYLSYYEKWASVWERQMLLRARPGAGDPGLTGAVIAGVEGFRYPDGGLTAAQTAEIRKLKSRMEKERIPKGIPRERHLKLGPGGLSDVEWTVQLLQLRHGHAHEELRNTSTVGALAALSTLGLIDRHEASTLESAWRTCSALRDAIMLVRGRAGDALPSDTRELAAISVLLGYRPREASRLLEDVLRRMRRAYRVVDDLFWS